MPAESPNRIADELLALMPANADAYAQKVDFVRSAILVIAFDREAYRAASFLDDRILTPTTRGAWLPIARVAEALTGQAQPLPVHFIFHTGHVGSTLLSRLLDETECVQPLREPLPLRSLAEALDALDEPQSLLSHLDLDAALALFMKLWGRGYPSLQCAIVKATSTAGRAACHVLERYSSARAVYLNLRAEPYLATLLAGQNSGIDLRGHAAERTRRLQHRVAQPLQPIHALSIGELAALAWLAESLSQADAIERLGARVLPVDFDALLGAVGESMTRIAAHFGLRVDARYADKVTRSAVLTRYSKAPEHEYTPAIRAEILADSRRRNADEIRRGMAWLERMAGSDVAVAAVLGRQVR